MPIPTGGSAALLTVAVLAVAACGDEAPPATQADGSAAVQTVTQTATATATATAPQQQPSGTTTKPATTQKTQPQTTTQPGSATSGSPTTTSRKPSGVCESVEIGVREGEVDATYARITQAHKVDCATAKYIASQWGSKQLGIDKALLPLDWKCTRDNVCMNGSRRVAFVLERPAGP